MTCQSNTAQIIWKTDQNGFTVPVSKTFDDVYFSRAGGLNESDYVFLQNNDLPNRFDNLWQNASKTSKNFVIAETGFGTGLNFLATLCLWRSIKKQSNKQYTLCQNLPRLHFITTEKYPLNRDDLQKSLQIWADKILYDEPLSPLIDELIHAYPFAIQGCHRRHFDDVILDIWVGDACDSLNQLINQYPTCHRPSVDAWFLDGFSPQKNESLWSKQLFDCIKALSSDTTTLATFTCAGDIKRKLIDIGATPVKVKGFGHKRHMLTAHFKDYPKTQNTCNKDSINQDSVNIIGAGIAGLSVAYALAQSGIKVTLFDKKSPLAGASGNHRAIFAPKLTTPSNNNPISDNLSLQGFLYGVHFYDKFAGVFEKTGVIDFLLPNKKSDDKCQTLISHYPSSLVYKTKNLTHTNQTFTAFLPSAGLISPHAFAKTVLAHPNICFIQDTANQKTINNITSIPVIICAGFDSPNLHANIFDGRKIRGQVSYIDRTHPAFDTVAYILPKVVKHEGYACIADDVITLGASFVRNSTDTSLSDSEHAFNLDKINSHFDNLPPIDPKTLGGRAGIRLQTPDYQPIVGQIDGNVYALTALGSKGFCFAPLCGQIIKSLICREFLPISHRLLYNIGPFRPRLHKPLDTTD